MRVYGQVSSTRLDELERYVAGQQITEHVVRDALASGLGIDDVVQMDEFTIDLLVELPDGLVLVYDTT